MALQNHFEKLSLDSEGVLRLLKGQEEVLQEAGREQKGKANGLLQRDGEDHPEIVSRLSLYQFAMLSQSTTFKAVT
jgi:hypothetical protein